VNQPEIDLLDHGGRAQRMIPALGTQAACRELAQLVIHDRNELIESILVSAAPCLEQVRYVLLFHRPLHDPELWPLLKLSQTVNLVHAVD
jgi:hypothetical protein